jgi:hypothetical protein
LRVAGNRVFKLHYYQEPPRVRRSRKRRLLLRTQPGPPPGHSGSCFVFSIWLSAFDPLVFDIKQRPMRSLISHPSEL